MNQNAEYMQGKKYHNCKGLGFLFSLIQFFIEIRINETIKDSQLWTLYDLDGQKQPSALAARAEPGHPQSLQPNELPQLQHNPMHCILHHQHTMPSNATFRCRPYNGRWPKCSVIASGQTSNRVRAADLELQAIRKARKKEKKWKTNKQQNKWKS